MQHSNRWRVAALLLAAALALGVSACSRGQTEETTTEGYRDATVEPVAGSDLSRVTLSAQAADRLGIKTAQVSLQRVAAAGQAAAARKVIPYSAVIYDESGDTWTFTSPRPLTYLRRHIAIDVITGDMAVLSEGPPVGTTVVTTGAAELLGTELGVGEG
jgi:hypothetical protein